MQCGVVPRDMPQRQRVGRSSDFRANRKTGLLTLRTMTPACLSGKRTFNKRSQSPGNGQRDGFAKNSRLQRRGRPGFTPEFPVSRQYSWLQGAHGSKESVA
jgi:hypothetical protein